MSSLLSRGPGSPAAPGHPAYPALSARQAVVANASSHLGAVHKVGLSQGLAMTTDEDGSTAEPGPDRARVRGDDGCRGDGGCLRWQGSVLDRRIWARYATALLFESGLSGRI